MARHALDRTLREFADEYRSLHRRGLNHAEVADAMGYSSAKTVARLVHRARCMRLLPPARHGAGCTCPLLAVTR